MLFVIVLIFQIGVLMHLGGEDIRMMGRAILSILLKKTGIKNFMHLSIFVDSDLDEFYVEEIKAKKCISYYDPEFTTYLWR